MKSKRITLFLAIVLFALAIVSPAELAFAKGSSAQDYLYIDPGAGASSTPMELIAFNASMGPASSKWKSVDKTSLPALENFRFEYNAAKNKLPEGAKNALNDSSFVAELDSLIAKSGKTFPKSFKVLSIGNSFSVDAVKYLYKVAKSAGVKEIIVASMHITACDIKSHRVNAENDFPVYKYKKNKNGKIKSFSNVSILSALRDENWDYVTLQQSSNLSGVEKSYNNDLNFMANYILKNRPCPSTKLCWHMTWAYSKKYENDSFEVYDFNQQNMYDTTCNAVRSKIVPNKSFSVLIPVGTAIQNLRTSYIKDRLNRDGRHLNAIGQYTAALTFVRSLGYDIDNIEWTPKSKKLSKAYLPAIKASVNDSLCVPLSVTNESRICNHKATKDSPFNTVVENPGRLATCESSGYSNSSYCRVCKEVIKQQRVIPKLSTHNFLFKIRTPATMKADGTRIGTCKVCGKIKNQIIPMIKSVSLSKSVYAYSQKPVTPKVTITDRTGNLLRENTDYTLSYPDSHISVGKHKIEVVFKNKYKGKSGLEFKITLS